MWKIVYFLIVALVSVDAVPPECGLNEEYKNNTCDKTCEDPFAECLIIDDPGCYCLPDHVRNSTGNCILISDCPQMCPPLEEYNSCPEFCSHEDTCDILFRGLIPGCPSPDTYVCTPRCQCQFGLVRNGTDCIETDLCCEGPNEVAVDCPAACDITTTLERVKNCECNIKGCRCKPGFARDADGVCVELGPVCKEDEQLNTCVEYCAFENTCPMLFEGMKPNCTYPPPDDFVCGIACECRPGLIRNGNNCTNIDLCCEDPNEMAMKCPSPCDFNTDGVRAKDCPCSTNRVCRCKSGFARDSDGACVEYGTISQGECKEQKCPPLEIYNHCPGYCDREPTCPIVFNGLVGGCPNPNTYVCKPRCECRPGLLRDGSDCIVPDLCCKGLNEMAVDCPAECDMTTEGKRLDFCMCRQKGCRCKPGFARDPNGVCVEYGPKCGPLEVLNSCPEYCTYEKTCESLFVSLLLGCPDPATYVCQPRCECTTGLVRNGTDCIDPNLCCKGPNELAVDCPAECDMTTKGQRLEECDCFVKGCRCKIGFVRDEDGVCVEPENCNKCDINEIWINGTCDGTCEEPNRKCRVRNHFSCFCIPGFVRNDEGKCVPLCECNNPVCGTNEEYKEGTCDGTCEEPNRQCRIRNHFACFCLEGFVRDKAGNCTDSDLCDDSYDPVELDYPCHSYERVYEGDWDDLDDIPHPGFRKRAQRGLRWAINWLKERIQYMKTYCYCF